MNKLTIIFIAILVVILVVTLNGSFSINIGPKNTSTTNRPVNSSQNTTSNGLATKESSEGPVSVSATPTNLGNGSSSWDFAIALNTHSEDLTADLVAVSELIDDQGKSYKPVSWEGSPPGGHHRNGVLKFNPISPKPKAIELKIKNVGGVAERSFKWDL